MTGRQRAGCIIVAAALWAGLGPAPARAQRPTEAIGRGALVPPLELWEEVRSELGSPPATIGYDASAMAHYGRDRCLMPKVVRLFADARMIPRFSGRTGEGFLAAGDDLASLVRRAYALTEISAGRRLPLADSASWGAAWLADDRPAGDALLPMLSYQPPIGAGARNGERGGIVDEDWLAWNRLPEVIQRLVVRLFVGAAEATPWIQAAYDRPFLAAAIASAPSETWFDAAYRFATAPWIDEREGQLATLEREAIVALDRLDRDYLAFGSVLFAAHVRRAINEYRAAGISNPAAFRGVSTCEFETALGVIRILDAGGTDQLEPAFLTIDVGGNDIYRGRHAAPRDIDHPIALLIDLAGDDIYDGGDQPGALGCGLFGVGMLIDLDGNDRYRVHASGLGAAWHGTGVLLDCAGRDRYEVRERWGAGAAHAGIGLLVDLAGDDDYVCGYQSQGLGSTYGAGVLIDATGNDSYLARDDGNISALYNGQSVSMAQGVGYGRRADLGDGHSLAGGFGVLVDGAGDDSYHATAWSQGAGYWWAVGLLEDLGGNDRYRNGKYSLGAAAHFAIGCQVDLEGNDRYNVGHRAAVNQFQGHARDGSIGISIDGGGDDAYLLKSHCGGSGDLASIGLFWDRAGRDRYDVDYPPPADPSGWNDTPPLGTTTVYAPFRSFRDDLDAYGIFLDTGGADTYVWPGGPAGNDHVWHTRRGERARGVGLDRAREAESAPRRGGRRGR